MSYRVQRRIVGDEEWRQTHAGVGSLQVASKHARARVYGPPSDGRVLDESSMTVVGVWLYDVSTKQMRKVKR